MVINVADVKARLKSFGYELKSEDDWVLVFLVEKVTNGINNECNIDGIPEGLYQIAVDMVCGEFLMMKKGSGQLDDTDISTEAAIKSIHEGDTSITYAVSDGAASTIDGLIDCLMNRGKEQFAAFRRFKW